MVLKPKDWSDSKASTLPRDSFQTGFKGHVIAFPNRNVEQTVHILQPLSQIKEFIQLVFVKNFKSGQDLKEAASKCKCLHVRGRELVAWAKHRAKV